MRNRLEIDYLRVPHWLTPCFGFYFIPKSQAHTFVQELRGSELDCSAYPRHFWVLCPGPDTQQTYLNKFNKLS